MTHRILIVDDDSSFRALCIRMFRKRSNQDWSIAEAADGAAAIDIFAKEKFDCVMVDYRLPEMLGTELIPLLQQQSEREVPMILLSAGEIEPNNLNAAVVDACSFVSKSSVGSAALIHTVEDLLRAAQSSCCAGDKRVAEH